LLLILDTTILSLPLAEYPSLTSHTDGDTLDDSAEMKELLAVVVDIPYCWDWAANTHT
jgi:hypothetical protein